MICANRPEDDYGHGLLHCRFVCELHLFGCFSVVVVVVESGLFYWPSDPFGINTKTIFIPNTIIFNSCRVKHLVNGNWCAYLVPIVPDYYKIDSRFHILYEYNTQNTYD